MAILDPAIAEKLGVSFSFVGRYVSRLFDTFNIFIVIILPEKKKYIFSKQSPKEITKL